MCLSFNELPANKEWARIDSEPFRCIAASPGARVARQQSPILRVDREIVKEHDSRCHHIIIEKPMVPEVNSAGSPLSEKRTLRTGQDARERISPQPLER